MIHIYRGESITFSSHECNRNARCGGVQHITRNAVPRLHHGMGAKLRVAVARFCPQPPHGVRRAAPNAALCDAAPRGTRHAGAAECRRDHRIPPMPEDAIRRSHLPSADPAIGAPFAARRAASGVRQRDGREIACGDRAFLPVAAARRAARNFRLWEQVRYFVRAWRGAAGRPQRSATGAQYTLPSLTFTALSKAGVLRTAARQPLFASARA